MSDHQELRDQLRLKYIPFNPTPELIEKAEAFLCMPDADQSHALDSSYNEDAEFLISLMTARALYKDPVDANPGSITQDKVDRYPERYKWTP